MVQHLLGSRIWIIGCPGAGKSTLGGYLGRSMGVVPTELDALFWNENWRRSSEEEMYAKVKDAMKPPSWIIIGYYEDVADVLAKEADVIIWLDLPIWVLFWRVLMRSTVNGFKGTELWNGNKESLARLFTRDSMPLYVLKISKARRASNQRIVQDSIGKKVIWLNRRRAVRDFIKSVTNKGVMSCGA